MRVEFMEGKDFLEEMALDKDLVERKIVRIWSGMVSGINTETKRVVVEAGYTVTGTAVRLVRDCGLYRPGQREEAKNVAENMVKKIRKEAELLGLVVRGGIFREAGEAGTWQGMDPSLESATKSAKA